MVDKKSLAPPEVASTPPSSPQQHRKESVSSDNNDPEQAKEDIQHQTLAPPSIEAPQPGLDQTVRSLYDLISLAGSATSLRAREEEGKETYRRFTKRTWEKLLIREEEERRKALDRKNRPSEGKLVDGEIKFDSEETEGEKIDKDPELMEGNLLPESRLGECPPELFGEPLEEIDKYIKDKTFIVINSRYRRKYIYRYTASKVFFILSPWNPVRRVAIKIATNQFFDYFIMATILTNCVFLALNEDYPIAEYTFLAIYTLEMFVRLTGRGFALDNYTYLRDPWNWLDMIVVLGSYGMIIAEKLISVTNGNVSSLRTFRVFRVLKTITIFPGLKTIISALLKSLKMLFEVIMLTMFCMSVFALLALQVYMGILRNKCVRNPTWLDFNNVSIATSSVDNYYQEWIKTESNWLRNGNLYWLCGNATGAGKCSDLQANYSCLPNLGDNPNWGYTNFDNFGMALLSIFQLITLDFWEDLYDKVIRVSGPWNIFFFIVVVFFGSFYLINLMLAVVTLSYEEEAVQDGKSHRRKKRDGEQERERQENKKKKKKKKKKKPEYIFDPNILRMRRKTKEEIEASKLEQQRRASSRQSLRSIFGSRASLRSIRSRPGTAGTKPTSEGSGKQSPVQETNTPTPGKSPKGLTSSPEEEGTPKDGVETSKGRLERKDTVTSSDTTTGEVCQASPDSGLGSNENVDGQQDDEGDNDSVEEDKGPVIIISDDLELVDRNWRRCATCCRCYIPWLKFQNKLYSVVTDPLFEIFITFCILANTIILALEFHNMPQALSDVITYSNYVFTGIFTVEVLLKFLAMGREFFFNGWNLFDVVVVFVSLLDPLIEAIDGLGSLRTMRLLRVFKLAQSWTTMRLLLSIIFSTITALGNLTFILLIVLFIFAVIGKGLFSNSYTVAVFGSEDEIPRWNFNNFFNSMLMVFRILCGEWIEPLWDCMRASGAICVIVFIPTLILGNFMVLNLFLALLLNSFASDPSLTQGTSDEDSKLRQVFNRLRILLRWKNKVNDQIEKQKALEDGTEEAVENGVELTDGKENQNGVTTVKVVSEVSNSNPNVQTEDSKEEDSEIDGPTKEKTNCNEPDQAVDSKDNGVVMRQPMTDMGTTFDTRRHRARFSSISNRSSIQNQTIVEEEEKSGITTEGNNSCAEDDDDLNDLENRRNSIIDEEEAEEEKQNSEVQDCCWSPFYRLCCNKDDCCSCCMCILCPIDTVTGTRWYTFRKQMLKITEHRVFEAVILLIILTSTISLCFEDIYLNDKPTLKFVLNILNYVFAGLFTIEMIMKWISHGLKRYFTNFWTLLDFIIVGISYTSIIGEQLGVSGVQAFRVLRTMRAFRPLRAISRWQGMKIVVNALMYAIPSIFNVLVVCLIFWIIFSIIGVQILKGRFYKCVDINGERLHDTLIPNKTACLQHNYTWENSEINFDNIAIGLIALFQVATYEGWIEIMADAVDATGIDQQPRRGANEIIYVYFVIFIIVGSFFALNLFIGVIIDNFNRLKKKYEGSYLDALLTASQRNYYNTMRKISTKKPQRTIRRPRTKFHAFFFDVAISNKFELSIVILIMLNMVAMMVEHHNQPAAVTTALEITNIIFTTIFTLEAMIKIIGLRWHYFRNAWNVFDFIIVIFSIIGVVLNDFVSNVFVTPTLLRVVRIFRIGRVLRLIKAAKGIRKLLFALIISLPALFNIGMLLVLMIVIFAIVGMQMFGNVKHTGALNDLVNFENFGRSFVLLFRLATSAGWNEILEPLLISPPNCNDTHTFRNGKAIAVNNGNCGIYWFAIFYLPIFVFITYLIIINMYIAIILENFNQAHEQEEVGVTEDDFDMFYVVWERYDPYASQFIKYDQLSDFVAELELPLGIPKPNVIALVSFDLPIVEGDKLHCLDILVSLVRHVLGDVEESDEFRQLKAQMEEKYRETFPTRVRTAIVSSTMKRKKEDIAAKTLQRAWRRHKAQRAFRQVTENAMLLAGKHLGGGSGSSSQRPSIITARSPTIVTSSDFPT